MSQNLLKKVVLSEIRVNSARTDWRANRPRSIYQYSNMAPRLSGQTSIFGVVFFVSKAHLGIEGKGNLKNLQFWLESLEAMLEYCYIGRGLLFTLLKLFREIERNMKLEGTKQMKFHEVPEQDRVYSKTKNARLSFAICQKSTNLPRLF